MITTLGPVPEINKLFSSRRTCTDENLSIRAVLITEYIRVLDIAFSMLQKVRSYEAFECMQIVILLWAELKSQIS